MAVGWASIRKSFLQKSRIRRDADLEGAIGRWTQNMIGNRHIEFGASYQCLQVPILEDIAHVERIPDPEPFTLFLVDHHVFTFSDEKDDGNGNVIIGYLVGK